MTQIVQQVILVLSSLIALTNPIAHAQATTPSSSPTVSGRPAGEPVVYSGQTLFYIMDLGPFQAKERARAISDRLAKLAKDPHLKIDKITLVDQEAATYIVSAEDVILVLTEAEARAMGRTRQELAQDYVQRIRQALAMPQAEQDVRSMLFSVLWTLLATGLLVLVWLGLRRLFPRLYTKLESWRGTRIRSLRVQQVEVLSGDVMTNALIWSAKGVHIAALALLLYFYLSVVFSFFPRTKGLAITLLTYLLTPFQPGVFREALLAILYGILFTVLATALLVIGIRMIQRVYPRITAKLEAWRGTRIRSLKIQRVEVLSADRITEGLLAVVRAIRVVVIALFVYFYASSILGFFPWTRGLSAELFGYILSSFVAVGKAFATYIPNVISIVVIIFVTRYIIKLIHLIFGGIERGAITFAGFRPEWAQPTYKIVRFLVLVFAAIAIFPYIPGSQSEGFRGISVFLGVLLSLGSAGAISNIIAGVVLTYMRPFRSGDRVKIADTIGDVTEKTLLVTRVRTIKNVEITIPNAMVLGSHIINFSTSARDRGLILHTSVTIGYDAPWRKVHELLIAAARTTQHILQKPEPFVLQTSLNDFYVTYELNAYTDQPNLMATIYAELHQNIQDKFNEAGVEIMSPHYTQIRDGNKVTIPDQYLPKSYQAPAFRLWPLGSAFSKSEDSASGKDTKA